MMRRPQVGDAPGLAWRPRGKRLRKKTGTEAERWVATWIARADVVKKGYTPETQRILELSEAPTPAQIVMLRSECTRMQEEMLAFNHGGGRVDDQFDGTLAHLIDLYRADPESRYQEIRRKTRLNYDVHCDKIRRQKGARILSALTARDFKRWYREWRWPEGKAGPDRAHMAHGSISMLRNVLGYGIAFEIDRAGHCVRLKTILGEIDFEKGGSRTERITHEQASLIVDEAIRRGEISIALTQAMQYDLVLHQKDCIGEWVPLSEPGLSDITWGKEKWLYGARWEEVSPDLVLTHRMAKSRKGKMLEFDLKLYPMVMKVLALIPTSERTGPMAKCEKTGLPWAQSTFSDHWRPIARAVGVPDHVWNMDSRAGGTTETIDATDGNLEAARKQAGHTNIKTTQLYSRGDLESNSKVAVMRAATRKKSGK